MTRRSLTAEAVTRLYFSLVPLSHEVCASCGYDPRHLYDTHNQFIIGHDETLAIDHKGQLCRTCALSSAAFIASYLGSSWGKA